MVIDGPRFSGLPHETLITQHNITPHTNYITSHYNYNCNCSCNCNCNYHHITLHYARLHYTALRYTTLHYTNYTTLQLQPPYFTLHYTRLHHTIYTTLQCTLLRYTTLDYTTYTTPQPQLQLHLRYTSFTTLQLHYATATTALHHTTPSSCAEVTAATPAATPKNTIPTTLSVYQWIRSAIRGSQQPTSPIGFLLAPTSRLLGCPSCQIVGCLASPVLKVI